MKSTIKIAHGSDRKAVIQFNVSNDTSDPRDWLCKDFTEQLGYSSYFCLITCEGVESGLAHWTIQPVPPEKLEDLRNHIDETIRTIKSTTIKEQK